MGILWLFAAYSVAWVANRVQAWEVGADLRFYQVLANHWLSTGVMYPGQLEGPYQLRVQIDNLYPPNAMLLFVPFTVLPAVLWWAIPLTILGYSVWHWRPVMWGWAALALVVIWPRTTGAILAGNTDMWMSAAVAGGLLWGWPAVLLTIKPTLAPLALLGIRHRSWWVAMGAMGVFVLLTLPLWFDYVTAIRDVRGLGWDYSLAALPLILAPVAIWSARRREPELDGPASLSPEVAGPRPRGTPVSS